MAAPQRREPLGIFLSLVHTIALFTGGRDLLGNEMGQDEMDEDTAQRPLSQSVLPPAIRHWPSGRGAVLFPALGYQAKQTPGGAAGIQAQTPVSLAREG